MPIPKPYSLLHPLQHTNPSIHILLIVRGASVDALLGSRAQQHTNPSIHILLMVRGASVDALLGSRAT